MTVRTREEFIARLRQAFAPLIEALQAQDLLCPISQRMPHPGNCAA
ncbi:MAG: hypothetical protein IMHGJWDQ_000134 [Candidatus Fervidibacter sp.]